MLAYLQSNLSIADTCVSQKSVHYNQLFAIESFGFFGQKNTTGIKMEDFFSYDTSKQFQ